MLLLKIVAITLCVASLQSLAECSITDEDRREIYREDLKSAQKDGFYSTGDGKKLLASMLLGNSQSQAATAYKFLNNAWMKSKDSKRLLEALGSLKEYASQNSEEGCDVNLYDQILSIVRMSDRFFEGKSVRDRMIRMLIFRMHDTFVTSCVRMLRNDFRLFYNSKYAEQLNSLAAFKAFLTGESPDLIRVGSYPDDSKSMMDKLKLVSNGDQAWSQFMKYAAVKFADHDGDRAAETETMPRKERINAQFDFVVNNACVPLTQSNVFVSLVEKISSLAPKLVFELANDTGLRQDFQLVERYPAMYKICMKLKDLHRDELMGKVELHTRENYA